MKLTFNYIIKQISIIKEGYFKITPKVMIILGSGSDIAIAEKSMKIFGKLEIPYSLKIASAHRTPDLVKRTCCTGNQCRYKSIYLKLQD